MTIFESGEGKRYVPESTTDSDFFLLRELTLDGKVSGIAIPFKKDLFSLVPNPSPPWTAAYLVWRNSAILEEANKEEMDMEMKRRAKIIELLALKYSIDHESLSKAIQELDDLEL